MITVSKTFETEAEASAWLKDVAALQMASGPVTEAEVEGAYRAYHHRVGQAPAGGMRAALEFILNARRDPATIPADWTDEQIDVAINTVGDWVPDRDIREQMRRAFRSVGARPS